jgi:hypothetical protein
MAVPPELVAKAGPAGIATMASRTSATVANCSPHDLPHPVMRPPRPVMQALSTILVMMHLPFPARSALREQ